MIKQLFGSAFDSLREHPVFLAQVFEFHPPSETRNLSRKNWMLFQAMHLKNSDFILTVLNRLLREPLKTTETSAIGYDL